MASFEFGRLVVALAAAVALLAGGTAADCFDYCFKNCVANDKSMADYCNYACGKTCDPGVLRRHQHRPLAVVVDGIPIRCQIGCLKRSCAGGFRKDRRGVVACYRGCFDSCKTNTVPRPPLCAGAGVDAASGPVSETKVDVAVHPTSEPDPDRYDAAGLASVPDHPFHEKKDAAVDPAAVPDHPFHEKQDAVEQALVPDHP
ncbi:hypothetical protein QOZ80_1AG0023060 [Eleusine coracana subsp. coracana]|nr:hypothetical protein QOZ80_1AG0023060 [Eleusine coracana subsp. coracana]